MSNPVLDAIASRYSCRDYTDEPVSRADLEALALAGVQAPSSRASEPWYLAMVTNRQLIADIDAAAMAVMRRRNPPAAARVDASGRNLFFNAPALIVVATKPTYDFTPPELDAGLLVENIALAAVGLGLATCISGYATQAFRDPRSGEGERLSKALGFPWGYAMTVAIVVGHPATDGAQHAPNLDSVRYFD